MVLFPFAGWIVRLAEVTVRDRQTDQKQTALLPLKLAALDERFLDQPSFAIRLCKEAADDMADLTRKAFRDGIHVLHQYSETEAAEVIRLEQLCDRYEDVLGSYLVRLSAHDPALEDSKLLSQLLRSISDFERISDHAVNLVESAQELRTKGLSLTPASHDELTVLGQAVADILDLTVSVFFTSDTVLAQSVEPLEEVVDDLCEEMKQRHILRLRGGRCSMEAGLILEDILTNYERISDHCSNVAVCLIETARDEFDTHEYLELKIKGNDSRFVEEYTRLKQQYPLPELTVQ